MTEPSFELGVDSILSVLRGFRNGVLYGICILTLRLVFICETTILFILQLRNESAVPTCTGHDSTISQGIVRTYIHAYKEPKSE